MHSDWHEIKRILHRALALPFPLRSAFLEKECGQAMALKRAVTALLEADEDLLGFVDRPLACLTVSQQRLAFPPGAVLGEFSLECVAAIAGTGTVYRARRLEDQAPRQVAIKVSHPFSGSTASLDFFRNECRILSRLRHPNVAVLLGKGALPAGTRYLAMEWIEGEHLDVFCIRRRLSVASRLRLLKAVCDTAEDIHSHGVVHGDLKPENILVTLEGTPKIVDFGSARLLSEPDREHRGKSPWVGWLTPEFSCPQRLQGELPSFSSDIYALGRLAMRLFREPCNQTRGLKSLLRKAVWSEPSRRYASARSFSEAIGSYLQGLETFSKKFDTSSGRIALYS